MSLKEKENFKMLWFDSFVQFCSSFHDFIVVELELIQELYGNYEKWNLTAVEVLTYFLKVQEIDGRALEKNLPVDFQSKQVFLP